MKYVSILTVLLCILYSSSIFSSPARRIPFSITLANGDSVTVVKRGNEFLHWIETVEDGSLVLKNDDKTYRIATPEERESFFSQPVRSKGKGQPSIVGLSPDFPTKGNMRSLVILVNFTDVKMQSETAHDDFLRMLNEEGYSDLGGTGSARDYYTENSMGQFTPYFDVVGPIELSHGYAYYGENNKGDDLHAADMIIEACKLIDDTTDFTQYDYNDDGFIDNVFVFYAGHGEATYNDDNLVWPHSWNITEYISIPVMLDGKRLDHYACSNEIGSDERMDGIGTFVHEFGHVLGLPDLYSTANTTAFTPNIWSVMDEGEYNNASRTPPYLTAFERYSLGWMSPVEILKDGCSVVMNDISANEGYIILTERDNEFFMLENRQQKGWDSYIPGHGMLVWHIDYDKYLWENNRVNNESSHQYVDIVEADGIQSGGTKAGDPFPGAYGITSFTSHTTPAFVDWSGNDVNAPLTDIREENGIIVLNVSGGGAPLEPMRYEIPELAGTTDITDASFVANWLPVTDAEGYYVGIGTMVPGIKRQAVADFTGGTAALDASWATNVSATFSNAAYAGASTPSLRMQHGGDSIVCHKDVVSAVSFWCRGSSVKAGTEVRVEWLLDDEVVATGAYVPTTTGTTVSYEANVMADGVRLSYSPVQGSGSVAIDDICVEYSDLIFKALHEEEYTQATSLTIGGLEADTDYVYYVVAAKDDMRSRQSEYGKIHTAAASGIGELMLRAEGRHSGVTNVSGQRVGRLAGNGIYIINGKKIVR